MAGTVATQSPKLSGDFAKVMKWADKYRTLSIRTNADTPGDASVLASLVPRASACAAQSTCSSRRIASLPCVR
jgi:hypothetical protein